MSAPIQEPTLGQPGWNAAFKQVLDRINTLDERIIDTIAGALIAGTGIAVSHNDAANSITISAGGAASLDTEALMDHLAAHIVPGTNLGLVYDDATGDITLNYTGEVGGAGGTGNPKPSMHNMVSWSIDPAASGSSTAPSAGDLVLLRVNVPVEATIASVVLQIATAGVSLTNCFLGLFGMDGTRLALSADQSTAFQTGGAKVVPFTTPPQIPAGDYYLAILIGGGTPPAISRGASATVTNLGTAAGSFRSCVCGTGLTAIPASITLASSVANNTAWCAGLRAA